MTLSLKTHLKTRKSHPIAQLGEPGPDDSQIEELVAMATRVPDHGKLQPWRFILYRGDSRHEIGERLATRYAEVLGRPLAPGETDKELTRFSRAPVVIGVVYVPRDNPKIPEWEMLLSAGAAAMNLLHAAQALGFGANWITNWYAEDAPSLAMLGLAPGERAVGFIHIGTPHGEAVERPRPDVSSILSEYAGPAGQG